MKTQYLAVMLSAILLSQAFTMQGVYGHATPAQTGTRVTVHADITSITVNWAKPVVDFNDGPDINGELTLQYSILESGHPEQMVTDIIQITDWNYDLYQSYPVNKNALRKAIPSHTIYTHDTCRELGEMHVHIMAVEEDKPDLGGFAKDRAKGAARSALAVLAGLTEVTAAVRGNVLTAMAAGVYWYMQENESLGSTIATFDLSNAENIRDQSITTTATEYGSVTVNVRIWTEENPDQACTSSVKKSAMALHKGDKTTKKSTDKAVKLSTGEVTQLKNDLKNMYQYSTFGEKFTSLLKKANDEEAKALKKLSGDAKSIYSKTKNSDAKKLGDKIQAQIKDTDGDKKEISAISADAKKVTKQILAIAKENKITKSDLSKPQDQNTKTNDIVKIFEALFDDKVDPNSIKATTRGDYWDRLAKIYDSDPDSISDKPKPGKDQKPDPKNDKPKTDQQNSDAPPESILDDIDTNYGADIGPKPTPKQDQKPKQGEKPDPKNDKPKTDQQNSDAPPESILDDVETDSGPDARAPKEKPKQDSSIDHARIAQDDMRIIEESLRQELLDQIRDTQLKIELERQLKDLKQKVVIEDTKKPIIQKDPTKLPETKTDNKPKSEVKPKSTVPEKTEKPVIQKDPIITEPKPSNTKPTLSIPKQVTYEATGPGGANVPFTTSSNDKEDGSLTPTCNPSSGSLFPIGATAVSCSVTDSNGNSVSGAFTVTVMDRTPPSFAPFQPTEGVRDDTGVQVFFDVTANDLVDGNVPVSCNYQSGYKFPPGVTELKCTASDSRGNQSTKTVQITVTVTESGQ